MITTPCNINCCVEKDYFQQKVVRFSSLTSQVGILALNALFFAGKANATVPDIFTRLSLVGLSFVGMVSLPYSVDLLGKTICDCLRGKDSGNKAVMVVAALKVIELASNIGLLCGGCIAALGGLFEKEDFQTTLYHLMIPWAEIILVLGFANLFIYLFMIKKALSKVSGNVVENLEACRGSPDAALVRLAMDKDTLRHLNRNVISVQDSTKEELVKVVKDNLETQLKWTQGAQLILILIGYLLMAVEKYYTPNSIQSAGINLAVSSAYTIKMWIEVLREVFQRHRISNITREVFV